MVGRWLLGTWKSISQHACVWRPSSVPSSSISYLYSWKRRNAYNVWLLAFLQASRRLLSSTTATNKPPNLSVFQSTPSLPRPPTSLLYILQHSPPPHPFANLSLCSATMRSPCCDNRGNNNKGAWSKEEDQKLIDYMRAHGRVCWRSLPKAAGWRRALLPRVSPALTKAAKAFWASFLIRSASLR